MAVDTLIRGATIIDGTGQPRYPGDIAIKGGKVVAVGKTGESAANVIDASGLAAAPGFWDVHTHYDAQLLWDPLASCSIWHGVTTVVMGNCGFTLAPVRQEDQGYTVRSLARVEEMDRSALESTLPWSWESFGGYLEALDGHLGVNVLAMVGHSAVRRYVMGPEASEREATESEISEMRRVLGESLRAGGVGLSSSRAGVHWDGEGLPVPSRLAADKEFRELALELRGLQYGFVQGIGPASLSAEMSEISGRPVLHGPITQTITAPPDAWKGQMETFQKKIKSGAKAFGMGPVNRTTWEMTFEGTTFFDRWPSWQALMIKPPAEQVPMMRDHAVRDRLREDMKEERLPILPFYWRLVTLVESPTGRWKRFEGKSVPEISAELGKDPLDAVFDISLDEDLKTRFRARDTRYPDEHVMMEILKAPHILVGMSDAGAHLARQINAGFPTRLLGYWSRERKALTVEEAVHILAARPADEIGIADRGRLLPGQAADIVLFDLDKVNEGERVFVNDLPGGTHRLVHHAHGIEFVIVNGNLVRQGDRDTGDLGGLVIRSRFANGHGT